jgi:hypothetical protein
LGGLVALADSCGGLLARPHQPDFRGLHLLHKRPQRLAAEMGDGGLGVDPILAAVLNRKFLAYPDKTPSARIATSQANGGTYAQIAFRRRRARRALASSRASG